MYGPCFVDDDFNCTFHTLLVPFPINATFATLNVSLIDDTILEGNESFTVTIDSSSKLPSGVTVGVTNEATVTIVDDDGKYVAICYYMILVSWLSWSLVSILKIPYKVLNICQLL